MGAAKSRIRFPLTPDIRKAFKAEVRNYASTRADAVGKARALRASRIADAKAACRADVAKAEAKFRNDRELALIAAEAKVAERAVAAELATT